MGIPKGAEIVREGDAYLRPGALRLIRGNTVRSISRIQSKCEKTQTMKTPNTFTLHAVIEMISYGHNSRHYILQYIDIGHGV